MAKEIDLSLKGPSLDGHSPLLPSPWIKATNSVWFEKLADVSPQMI